MSWTKRQFVLQAYEEIGLAVYAYDLSPEQLQSGMKKMDAMIATWNGRGIRLGYPIPSNPQNSDLDQMTEVPDSANEAIYLNLALRIAPSFGKIITLETRQSAHQAYQVLLSRAVMPNEMQISGLPKGAGYKAIDNSPFLDKPSNPILTGQDGTLDLY